MTDTWKEFEANEVTHSVAHHLVAIHEVGREYGGWARVSDIARWLGITRGSVSINLRNIKTRGLVIEDEHRQVKLSEEGLKIAQAIMAKKAAVKAFLRDVINVPEEQAEIDSCKVEHLISHSTGENLLRFITFLTSDNPAAREALSQFRKFEDR
ncbi:MAG: metal-dependent transcriptional regulator [Verrucomicrobia bacterium]|nr:metal-dependent transcriptional regulator [Verrucomicrobiota bacterium]